LTQLLITGFTPFDGRTINGSWVAAQTYPNAEHLEIPVVWGKPMDCLRQAVSNLKPRIVLSMGEGREGWFDIETRAQNQRNHRLDNLDQYPTGLILENGPEVFNATVDAQSLHQKMAEQSIPIRTSTDAGQFICEETLYCLEHLKTQFGFLECVLFVHLPPFGTHLSYRGKQREVDAPLLQDFVARLVAEILNLSDVGNISHIASHQTKNRG
jgi:pyroglutamyl-peptidase